MNSDHLTDEEALSVYVDSFAEVVVECNPVNDEIVALGNAGVWSEADKRRITANKSRAQLESWQDPSSAINRQVSSLLSEEVAKTADKRRAIQTAYAKTAEGQKKMRKMAAARMAPEALKKAGASISASFKRPERKRHKDRVRANPVNPRKDRSGQIFGRLTVTSLRERHQSPSGHVVIYWWCDCECGRRKLVSAGNLQKGSVTSCGCLSRELTGKRVGKDLTGQQFGFLTVIERAFDKPSNHWRWLCECSCGGNKIVSAHDLVGGSVRSCGCLRRRTRFLKPANKAIERSGGFLLV